MSKCKAVLDGDKITEIRVRTKAQESQSKDELGVKNPNESPQTPATTQQPE
jgi:hypothetical protein